MKASEHVWVIVHLPRQRRHRWGIAIVAAALLGGCAARIHWDPDEEKVDKVGFDEAAKQLFTVLDRAINPRVGAVSIDKKFLQYHGGIILFDNISRIQIYDNYFVFVWQERSPVQRILFANLEDAKEFTELLIAFTTRRAQSS